jgi:hypothetical protein
MRRPLLALALALAAAPVSAQQVKIAFHDGQVTLETNGASPRAILAEWSRVGGTNVVNGERVTGAPLTLRLVDVPEAQALEVVLRSVAGYMAAPRGRTPGASRYDRILVMPTSATPVASTQPTTTRPNQGAPFGPAIAPQRFMGPQRQIAQPQPTEDPPEPVEEPAENPPAEPVFSFPQPNQPNNYRQVPAQPVQLPPATPPDQPASGSSPGFGVVGAPMPGMIQQPPPAPPATPGRPAPRPPGQ